LLTFIFDIPEAVIAVGFPTGFVILQERFTLQLEFPEVIIQEGEAGVRVPDIIGHGAVLQA
jgi:hypothetical protein